MKTLTFALTLLLTALGAQAKLVTRSIPYEHNGVKLEGYLAYDDSAKGRLPGVLVIHEWWGLNAYVKDRAEQLAKMGYVAFALDMYGKGVTAADAKKAGELAGQFYGKPLMAERARAGLEQLLKSDKVDAERVASIGFCFGGAVSQALAYSGAPLRGIVSFHGSLIPPPAGAVKEDGVKFLILNGAADTFVSAQEIQAFKEGMEAAKADYQFIDYAGALHAFTNPGADKVARETGIKIAYDEAAARRSWAHMKLFFDELFAR